MSNENEIQRLTRLALAANRPHIRRMAALIPLGLEGLDRAGIPWEARQRYVSINNGEHRGKYVHPKLSPRRRGGLAVIKMNGQRLGPVVLMITTLQEAIAFNQNPQL